MPHPGYLLMGKTRYPMYRRPGRPQGRFGQVQESHPPPGFDSPTVQPLESLHRLHYPSLHVIYGTTLKLSSRRCIFRVYTHDTKGDHNIHQQSMAREYSKFEFFGPINSKINSQLKILRKYKQQINFGKDSSYCEQMYMREAIWTWLSEDMVWGTPI